MGSYSCKQKMQRQLLFKRVLVTGAKNEIKRIQTRSESMFARRNAERREQNQQNQKTQHSQFANLLFFGIPAVTTFCLGVWQVL
jgi:hypothetical protein